MLSACSINRVNINKHSMLHESMEFYLSFVFVFVVWFQKVDADFLVTLGIT